MFAPQSSAHRRGKPHLRRRSILRAAAAAAVSSLGFAAGARADYDVNPVWVSASYNSGSAQGGNACSFDLQWTNADGQAFWDGSDNSFNDLYAYLYISEGSTTGPWTLWASTLANAGEYDNSSNIPVSGGGYADVFDTGVGYSFYIRVFDDDDNAFVGTSSDVITAGVPSGG